MAWQYKISTGEFSNPDIGARFFGYSGQAGLSCNNPLACPETGTGPIPPGQWTIGIMQADNPKLGKNVLPLEASPMTLVYGREGFFVHGENPSHPGKSSDGCIVLADAAREFIANSGDKQLWVIP